MTNMLKRFWPVIILALLITGNANAYNIVKNNAIYVPNPAKLGVLSLGHMYVGNPDTDPTVVENQKTIYVKDESGAVTAVSQPLTIGAGGLPLYNGDPVTVLTDGDYSLMILNSLGSQIYYIPSDLDSTLDTAYVADIATLRLSTGVAGQSVQPQGYYAYGDGAGGPLRTWGSGAAPGTYVDNGGSIIVPTGGDGSAAWLGSSVYVWSPEEFGAVGDGATDDSASIQAAVDAVDNLKFKSICYVGTTIQLPDKNMDISGAGRTSGLIGSVSPLVAYDSAFATNTPNIHDLSFEATGDNISLKMHGVWDSNGKAGPTIKGNYFLNSSVTTTTAKCISLSGVWTANIIDNHFDGMGLGSAPTTGIGGYGIFILLGDDLNTSVMNLNISGNKFLTLAYPYWASDRTLNGRVEGVQLSNNSFVAGYEAIRSSASVDTQVTGNLISDFDTAIDFNADFSFNISSNVDIDGKTVGIKLSATSGGILERGTICGNNIKASGTGNIGIELVNDISDSRLRSVAITGNNFSKTVSGTLLDTGVKFNNTFKISNVTITGNTFQQLLTAVDVGSVAAQINTITGNNCIFVTNPTPILSSGYALTSVKNLTGGAATEIIDVAIPAGVFFKPPISGYCVLDGTSASRILAFFMSSIVTVETTTTNARFEVFMVDGTNLPAGNQRFNIGLMGY
jgi:hypothetical protein